MPPANSCSPIIKLARSTGSWAQLSRRLLRRRPASCADQSPAAICNGSDRGRSRENASALQGSGTQGLFHALTHHPTRHRVSFPLVIRPDNATQAQVFTLSFVEAGMPGAYQLREGETLIGRSASCDLVISAPTISRQHACVRLTDGRVFLRDAGSRYGT